MSFILDEEIIKRATQDALDIHSLKYLEERLPLKFKEETLVLVNGWAGPYFTPWGQRNLPAEETAVEFTITETAEATKYAWVDFFLDAASYYYSNRSVRYLILDALASKLIVALELSCSGASGNCYVTEVRRNLRLVYGDQWHDIANNYTSTSKTLAVGDTARFMVPLVFNGNYVLPGSTGSIRMFLAVKGYVDSGNTLTVRVLTGLTRIENAILVVSDWRRRVRTFIPRGW